MYIWVFYMPRKPSGGIHMYPAVNSGYGVEWDWTVYHFFIHVWIDWICNKYCVLVLLLSVYVCVYNYLHIEGKAISL